MRLVPPDRQWFYGRPSARSLPLVAKVYKELGHELLYWADTFADDLPYYTVKPGGDPSEGLVMMPYSLDCVSRAQLLAANDEADGRTTSNSGKLSSAPTTRLPNTSSTHLSKRNSVEVKSPLTCSTIREEGLEGKAAYITVALHSRWIGRPGRFPAWKRIIEHFTSFDDVWFATREQIARHWTETYPYSPK